MATAALSLFAAKRDPLARWIAVSFAVHVAALAGILGWSIFFSTPTVRLDQKPIEAHLVRLGKARDKKLLPVKPTPPPPPKGEKSAPEKPQPEAPKAAVALPHQKARPTHRTRGKSEAKSHKNALFDAFQKISKSSKDDPEGAADGDPNGDSAQAEGKHYWALLESQVRRNYDVSQTIPEQERMHLRAQVALRIGRAGRVLSVKLVKSSGNSLFDNAVLAAVKQASPFSPPPDGLRDSLQREGVVLEFRP